MDAEVTQLGARGGAVERRARGSSMRKAGRASGLGSKGVPGAAGNVAELGGDGGRVGSRAGTGEESDGIASGEPGAEGRT